MRIDGFFCEKTINTHPTSSNKSYNHLALDKKPLLYENMTI
jgi:hypothetical protein